MTEDELDEYFANYPTYEMVEIMHPEYSHCIAIEYGDTIMAYKDRKTSKWYMTDYLVDHRPASMEVSYSLLTDNTRAVPVEEMLTYFTVEELFAEML